MTATAREFGGVSTAFEGWHPSSVNVVFVSPLDGQTAHLLSLQAEAHMEVDLSYQHIPWFSMGLTDQLKKASREGADAVFVGLPEVSERHFGRLWKIARASEIPVVLFTNSCVSEGEKEIIMNETGVSQVIEIKPGTQVTEDLKQVINKLRSAPVA